MTEADDIELLRQYARENSEAAFAALVGRHVHLVYSVALRRVGNPHAAEEITQAVFIILARKAKSFSGKTILTGWLHQTTRLTAANFLRTEIRRQHREQEAFMQSAFSETETWTQIAPLLDDAISKLGGRDRDAILLRYFENKSAREMAAALRVDEPAAQKRVTRAVEKLRSFFAKRGVTLTAAAIAGAVSANSVQAAPVGLAATVTAAAAKGAAVSASTLTLIKEALKIMAWTKMKMAIAVGAGVLLAAGTTTAIVEKVAHPKLSSTDLSWANDPRYWEPNSRVLEKIPPVLILRTTKFPNDTVNIQASYRMMYKNSSIQTLISAAYGSDQFRTVVPDNLPQEHFDLMLTLPAHSREALQEEIKKQFGLIAHREKRQADVFYLKVNNPNAPGIALSKGGN